MRHAAQHEPTVHDALSALYNLSLAVELFASACEGMPMEPLLQAKAVLRAATAAPGIAPIRIR